jgi:hypothetical protein
VTAAGAAFAALVRTGAVATTVVFAFAWSFPRVSSTAATIAATASAKRMRIIPRPMSSAIQRPRGSPGWRADRRRRADRGACLVDWDEPNTRVGLVDHEALAPRPPSLTGSGCHGERAPRRAGFYPRPLRRRSRTSRS